MNNKWVSIVLQFRNLDKIFCAIVLLATAPCALGSAINIFMVDSYNPKTFEWTHEIHSGIFKGLALNGLTADKDFKVRYTTLAALSKQLSNHKQQSDIIIQEIYDTEPDVIICTDDDAVKWVCLRLETEIPVLFNGVNGDPTKYLTPNKIESIDQPGHHITGVYQTSYFSQGLSLLKQIYPKATQFAVMTDTSTTGLTLLKSLQAIDQTTLPMQWTQTLLSDDIEQWEKQLKEWQNEVDAIYVLSANALKNERGEVLDIPTATQRITSGSQLPGVASWEFQIRAGLLLSAADSGEKQGLLTASQLIQIIKGKSPGSLPIISPANGIPVVNIKRAKALGITIPQSLINTIIETGHAYP